MADHAPVNAPSTPGLAGRIARLGDALAASRETARLAQIGETETREALTRALREALIGRAEAEAQQRELALRLHLARAGSFRGRLSRLFRRGAPGGFDPGVLFDAAHYLVQAPPLEAGEELLAHYLRIGWKLGLSPHPVFDPAWYAAQAACEEPPLVHYLTVGWRQGLSPHPLVDPAWCLERSSDLRAAGVEPLSHYLTLGAAEGRDPGPWFSTARYVARRGDGLAAGRNPLVDYLQGGAWAVCDLGELAPPHHLTPLERWARNAGPIRGG